MILDEVHFTFGDFHSRQYNMIFAHINSQDFVNDNDILYGELSPSHIYNRRTRTHSYIGDNYADGVVQLNVEILHECGQPFTQEQRREIEIKLFHPKKFQTLYIDMDDDTFGDTYEVVNGELKRSVFNCRFINPKRIIGESGLTIGYSATMETDSIMMWQEPTSYYVPYKTSPTNFNIEVDTDIDGYTYPVFDIKGCDGELSIVNKTDNADRKTTVKYKGDLTIDSTISYVTKEAYQDFSTKNFPRLVNGVNQIEVTGEFTSLTLTFQNRRYIQ